MVALAKGLVKAEITAGKVHACTGSGFSTANAEVPDVVLQISYRPDSVKESVPESPNGETFFLLVLSMSCGRAVVKSNRHFVCILLIY